MLSFEEEWAQLKRDTAPQTRLASADGGSDGAEEKPVGPMGGLSVTSEAWTKYSQTVSALRGSTQGCLTQLALGQEGLTTNADGFACVTTHRTVAAGWRQRLEAVRDECEELATAMLLVRETYDRQEDDITSSFDKPSGTW